MNSAHSLAVIATALVFSVSLAGGQGGPDPSVLVGKIAVFATGHEVEAQ